MAKKYYEVLGVSENASENEIRKAFLKKSKECHPDTLVGKSDEEKKKGEEMFKEINEAYQVLSDKDKKAYYDMYGTMDPQMGTSGGMDVDLGEILRHMSERFGHNFGGASHTKTGGKVVVNLHITLKDVYDNIDKTFTYSRMEPCSECNGTGNADKQVHNCPRCNGTGVIHQVQRTNMGMETIMSTCPYCGGTGRDNSATPCTHCNGSGYEKKENTITVKVNINWLTNNYLTVEGGGNIPSNGGKPGPLIIKPVLDDYNGFMLDNNLNVIKIVEIPIIDCILGTNIKVECLDGKEVTVKVREGALDNEKYEIPNKGFKYSRGTTNMIVIIKQKMPTSLSKEDKKTLEKLKETIKFN